MDTFDVTAEVRQTGKSEVKKLKNEGFIPAILYGEDGNIPITIEEEQIRNILNKQGKDVFFNISLGGKSIKAKVKEVQRDPLSQEIKHIDLMPVENRTLH